MYIFFVELNAVKYNNIGKETEGVEQYTWTINHQSLREDKERERRAKNINYLQKDLSSIKLISEDESSSPKHLTEDCKLNT